MLSILLLLAACPTEVPEAGAPAATDAPAGQPAADGSSTGGPGAPSPTGNTEPLKVEPGQGVKLTGTATFEGTAEGAVRLDVLKQGASMPELVYSTTLEKLGPFEVELPKNFGSVQVTVFVDTTGDGPTVGEPMAASGFMEIGETPPAPLVLALAKLEAGSGGPPPSGAPPAGGEGAPPAGAPPAGAPPAGAGVEGGPPPGAAPPAGAPGTPPAAPG